MLEILENFKIRNFKNQKIKKFRNLKIQKKIWILQSRYLETLNFEESQNFKI